MEITAPMREKLGGLVEAVAGSALLTLPIWSVVLDGIVKGAHVITALCGAVIAVHGVARILKRKEQEDARD